MMNTRSVALATTLATVIALGGCSNAAEAPSHPSDREAHGLSLDESSPSRAAGIYDDGTSAVRFVVTKSDGARSIVIHTLAGLLLVDSTETRTTEVQRLLGGRLVVTARKGAPPSREGDEHAWDELQAMPEANAIRGLRSALDDANVAAAAAGPLESGGEVKPTSEVPIGSYNPMTYLRGGDYAVFWSNSFWQATYVYVYSGYQSSSSNPYRCLTFQGGAGQAMPICASGASFTRYLGYWWGLPVTVRNPNGYNDWMRFEKM